MSCYHPLKAFYTFPYTNKEGVEKFQTKIVPFETHHLEEHNGELWPIQQETASSDAKRVFYRGFTIPCGKCIGCRLDYSRTWANRLMCELAYHDPGVCWFVTLTYDNAHVPVNNYCDPETGEIRESLTLRKRDVQRFHKILRNSFPGWKLRFYLAGEYGEVTKRPHMHAIYFDLPLDFTKLELWSVQSQGFTLYKCPELEKIWRCGNVIVSPVSWQTCAYVARYVTKKLNGPAAEFYQIFNLEPEFALMSRKPGLGHQYIVDHPDSSFSEIILPTEDGKRVFMPPRYFKQVWQRDHPVEAAVMALEGSRRQDRKIESLKIQNGLADSDLLEYYVNEENAQLQRSKVLKRSVV